MDLEWSLSVWKLLSFWVGVLAHLLHYRHCFFFLLYLLYHGGPIFWIVAAKLFYHASNVLFVGWESRSTLWAPVDWSLLCFVRDAFDALSSVCGVWREITWVDRLVLLTLIGRSFTLQLPKPLFVIELMHIFGICFEFLSSTLLALIDFWQPWVFCHFIVTNRKSKRLFKLWVCGL